jgi:hypothetical protein
MNDVYQSFAPGLNPNFVWFMAVIEAMDDPLKLGRVKIRVIGKDTADKVKMPVETLPWASVLSPVNNPIFAAGTALDKWVIGFYLDGPAAQKPVVVGILPGIKTSKENTTQGFASPESERSKKGLPPEDATVAGAKLMYPSTTPWGAYNYDFTIIKRTNSKLIHACDVGADIKKSAAYAALKDLGFIRTLREVINARFAATSIIPQADVNVWTEKLKWLASKIKELNYYINLVKKFANALILYIVIIRAVVNWILSLPARILKFIKECLFAFVSSVFSVGSDLLSMPPGTLGTDYKQLFAEVKSVFNESKALVKNALSLAEIPANIINATISTNISISPDQIGDALTIANANLATVTGLIPSDNFITQSISSATSSVSSAIAAIPSKEQQNSTASAAPKPIA